MQIATSSGKIKVEQGGSNHHDGRPAQLATTGGWNQDKNHNNQNANQPKDKHNVRP